MKGYFTKKEILLWLVSITLIIGSFIVFDRQNYIAVTSSVIGVTAIILCAKGNPIGQMLMIIFCTIYGIISYTYRYYGEVITYACMTLPMSIIALVSWLKNPFEGKRTEVTVSEVKRTDIYLMSIMCVVVTVVLFLTLKYLGTENLLVSTLSVVTSFVAVFLSYKRSPYFALAYAVNDVVLIVLWMLASIQNMMYISVVICFATFLINDLYSFYNWKKMQKRQKNHIRILKNA